MRALRPSENCYSSPILSNSYASSFETFHTIPYLIKKSQYIIWLTTQFCSGIWFLYTSYVNMHSWKTLAQMKAASGYIMAKLA